MNVNDVDMAFLSEPKVFSHDMQKFMRHFAPDYCYYLNSDVKHDLDLPLSRSQAFGGTLVLWKSSLDSFISVHPVSTSSFLPVIYKPPDLPTSIHIALYLPTSGLEIEFIEELTKLTVVINDLTNIYPGALIFLRGDCNVNVKNATRSKIFDDFVLRLNLKDTPTNHNTYHHFMGDGLFDSNIDKIMCSSNVEDSEMINAILCQTEYSEVDSHHDIILSSVTLPCLVPDPCDDHLITAPRVSNSLHNIIWAEDDLPAYVTEVSSKLSSLRQNWSKPGSSISVSILLELTNQVLGSAPIATNRSCLLKNKKVKKHLKIPREILSARQSLRQSHKALKIAKNGSSDICINHAKNVFKSARKEYRFKTRSFTHKADLRRDYNLHAILTSNPSALFRTIRSSKKPSNQAVPFITVGDKRYVGDKVPDGLYDSISSLKKQNTSQLHSSPMYDSWSQDYTYILQLCKDKHDLPLLSVSQSTNILNRMKPSVKDIWSITPLHFKNAGKEGLHHFNFLLNQVIMEINSSTVKELNTVHAILLHKGHGKSRTSERSYRTISTCPVISKALDIHIHDLFANGWKKVQADTQYQGEGSSHELASLLVTEVVQQSLFSLKEPLFMLVLDARSALDTVVTEFLVTHCCI